MAMNQDSRPTYGVLLGSIGALLGAVAAMLSFAPFTPAVFTVLLTAPLGLVAIILGAWRTGLLALYWAGAAILVFPNTLPAGASELSVAAYPVGIILAVVLLFQYRTQRKPNVA